MNQIKKSAIISYLTVAFNIMSGILFTPYLINCVGNGIYGIYTLVTTFLNYFLMDFGLGNAVTKYVSEFRVRQEKKNEENFLVVVFKAYFVLATIIGIIFTVMFFFLDNFFKGLTCEELAIMKKMYIISAFFSILLFVFIPLDGILTSYELFTEIKSAELLRKILVIVLSVLALRGGGGVVSIVIVNSIVGIAIVGIKLYYVKKNVRLDLDWKFFDKQIMVDIGSFSLWLTLLLIAQRFIIPIAPTILGRYSNSTEISIFSIATTIEGYIYTIAACINGLFLPKLTRLKVHEDFAGINNLFIKVGRLQVFILGLVITSFIVFGKEFLILWVGDGFNNSYYVALLIMSSAIVVYSQEVANSLLMIENKVKYKAYCYLFGAIVSVVLSCILARTMGAIGTGIGIAVSQWGFQVILMNIIYPRISMLDIKCFFKTCYIKQILCMAVMVLMGGFFNDLTNRQSALWILALKIIIFCIIEGAVLVIVSTNRVEKLMFLNKIKLLKK